MSKADKMFEELGFEKTETITYKNGEVIIERTELSYRTDKFDNDDRYFEYVDFDFSFNHYEVGYNSNFGNGSISIDRELHLAIHEKLKELGWIDE